MIFYTRFLPPCKVCWHREILLDLLFSRTQFQNPTHWLGAQPNNIPFCEEQVFFFFFFFGIANFLDFQQQFCVRRPMFLFVVLEWQLYFFCFSPLSKKIAKRLCERVQEKFVFTYPQEFERRATEVPNTRPETKMRRSSSFLLFARSVQRNTTTKQQIYTRVATVQSLIFVGNVRRSLGKVREKGGIYTFWLHKEEMVT